MNESKIKSAVIFGRNLGFGYIAGQWLFRNLSFTLEQGEIMAVLGPNGCGKSMLLDIFLNIHKPLEGIIVNRQPCCFVPQFFTPPFAYSVSDIVLMGRASHINMFSTPKATDLKLASEALDNLGILSLADKDFRLLSGGQKQMVLIARALATESPIILLNEPTSALDLHNQNQVLSLLRRLADERKLTIIFTTHQPNHASLLADKTLLIGKKQTLFSNTTQILSKENLSELFDITILQQRIYYQQIAFRHFVPLYDITQVSDKQK